MDSKTYWAEREREALNHRITDEKEYAKRIEQIYSSMLDSVQGQIDSFYAKYADANGITISEAKKRVTQADIAAYERKAKRYVRDKDFSAKANEEMALYNLTMKVNRLEMLKANIGLELIAGHDELEKFMGEILQGRTMDELARQAGILGKTIRNNAAKAHSIVNASFRNATFSDRIWQYHDLMKIELSGLLQTALIQGKNPRAVAKDLRKYWYGPDPRTKGGAVYCMERLMTTELARVQTEAQKQSFVRNGFGRYMFIVNGGCCDICAALSGKTFEVEKMMPGENAPPLHPLCRCSTAAAEDSEEYEAWLDHLANGGTSESWQRMKDGGAKAEKLDAANFPEAFTKGAEKKNTQKFVEYVNSLEGANADTIKLYNSMGKLESIASKGYPFKIGHGKNHAVKSRMYYNGDLVDTQLVIPKLSGDNLAGQITTMLHEKMHLIDMYCRTDTKKAGGWFSTTRTGLAKAFKTAKTGMSDDVAELFGKFNAEYKATREAVRDEYTKKRADLRESYFPNNESVWSDISKYRQYEKEAKKLDKWYEEELDYRCRNIMGGGVNSLQDIYDALSGGQFRDNGTVIYGHGSSYYKHTESRVEETLANYGALSVTHPELIELLRADNPELVAELEAAVKDMIRKAGE